MKRPFRLPSYSRRPLPVLYLILIVIFCVAFSHAQQCSKTTLCQTGCCSQHGYCGTTSDHCGTGCLSTCDYKPPATECDKNRPCKSGCCSSSGFCGESAQHCGNGCQSSCDWKPPALACDANKPCAQGCCSKHGYCGFGKDCRSLRAFTGRERAVSSIASTNGENLC
jgi:hypothetical protein